MITQNELSLKIHSFLDKKEYSKAITLLDDLYEKSDNLDITLLAEIAGSYISLGDESYDLKSIRKGMVIFEENSEQFGSVISEVSINYCLGNGHQAIYKIENTEGISQYPTPRNVKESLFDAKQCFLRAYKQIDLVKLDSFSVQVLNNLANNLSQSGRIVEALRLFDIVLNYNPRFPEALVSKAETLLFMLRATNCSITISLFVEIYNLYRTAQLNEVKSLETQIIIENGIEFAKNFLKKNGFDFKKLDEELKLNEIEYRNHPPQIKYYLDNHLSLTEHGLYCKCNGSKIDDLTIGCPKFQTTDIQVLKLELLLNRVKSEYSLARTMYYQYFHFINNEENIHYEEILKGLNFGLNNEKLRLSFKTCFGILDKIALGICDIYQLLDKPNENIYFESFWNPKKNQRRWERINQIQNIHLTALYSIACDLNQTNGEFGFYKKWRNQLEHGVFNTIDIKDKSQPGLNQLLSDFTTKENFEDKTKHLLQLTRSAIFSFVFCVRKELIPNH